MRKLCLERAEHRNFTHHWCPAAKSCLEHNWRLTLHLALRKSGEALSGCSSEDTRGHGSDHNQVEVHRHCWVQIHVTMVTGINWEQCAAVKSIIRVITTKISAWRIVRQTLFTQLCKQRDDDKVNDGVSSRGLIWLRKGPASILSLTLITHTHTQFQRRRVEPAYFVLLKVSSGCLVSLIGACQSSRWPMNMSVCINKRNHF